MQQTMGSGWEWSGEPLIIWSVVQGATGGGVVVHKERDLGSQALTTTEAEAGMVRRVGGPMRGI